MAVCGLSCLSSFAVAQNADGFFLLTENGINNPEYSTYKNARVLKTGGDYFATPAFDKQLVELGENGTITAPTPFTSGVLTNGDITSDYKRRPMPYAYWARRQKATLLFDLKKNYEIARVRVHVLMTPKVHGVGRIGVYTWDEMLEAGSQPMQELVPQNGWNEFAINKPSDKIKLDFTQAPDSAYMTITEVEIWGKETAQPVKAAATQPKTAPRAYRAFDFGPAGSPVFEGFTTVDDKAVYSKAKGYGWIPFTANAKIEAEENRYGAGSTDIPGLLGRDRGKEVKIHDALFQDFLGAQKAYHPQLAQQFATDVKNGKYVVYLTTGDLVYGKIGASGMTVDAEGRRVVNGIQIGSDLTETMQFETEVTDGQLNLLFSNTDPDAVANWNVSGLCIFPSNNAAEKAAALKEIAALETQIKGVRDALLLTSFKKVEREKTTALFPLSDAQRERGYLLFARDWMETIYPDTVPLQREVENAQLSLAAAPGEYEPVALGVYPLAKGLEGTIELSDLTGENQAKIGKENISVRIAGYLNERIKNEKRSAGEYSYYLADSSWGNSYMEGVPKVLRPYNSKVAVDGTQQIWLTVHVPTNAKPGQYRGTLAFKPQNRPAQTVPVMLTVYPIALQKSPRVQGMYWSDRPLYPQNLRKQLDDMARHGIRAVVLGGTVIPELKNENGQMTVDFTRMDELVTQVVAAGLTGPTPFLTSSVETSIARFRKANPDVKITADEAYQLVVRETLRHSKANNWPEILFYPVDEIGNSADRLAEFKRLGALIRAADKNAKIYVTANSFAAGQDAAEFIDYQCVNIPLSKEQEQEILNSGKVYMRYGNSYNYNPRISRTVSGLGFWRIPATTMYYWHYQYASGDPFNSLDGTGRDHISSYPSPDGPLNSIDFEAMREGMDDLNYIATLQSLLEKAKQSGTAPAAVQAGEAILQEIRASDPSYSQYDLMSVPNAQYHQWRERMAQAIIQLQGAAG